MGNEKGMDQMGVEVGVVGQTDFFFSFTTRCGVFQPDLQCPLISTVFDLEKHSQPNVGFASSHAQLGQGVPWEVCS